MLSKSLPLFIFNILLCTLASACSTSNPTPAFRVTPLLKTTLTGDDSKQVLIGRATFEPGASTGRHTHPGDEYATVIKGELTLHVDGREDHSIRAGEAYQSSKGVVHETVNTGKEEAEVISTFVLDKNQPLVIRAPN